MTRASFLDRTNKQQSPAHRRSPKQERELAKRGGGRLTPGSGSGRVKGDVRRFAGVIRIEAKTTSNKSFSVTKEMIDKLENACLPENELPAIIIEFLDERGKPVKEVAVAPTYVFDTLIEMSNER
jgi:hypothetical protein